jgi:hypothetical protein
MHIPYFDTYPNYIRRYPNDIRRCPNNARRYPTISERKPTTTKRYPPVSERPSTIYERHPAKPMTSERYSMITKTIFNKVRRYTDTIDENRAHSWSCNYLLVRWCSCSLEKPCKFRLLLMRTRRSQRPSNLPGFELQIHRTSAEAGARHKRGHPVPRKGQQVFLPRAPAHLNSSYCLKAPVIVSAEDLSVAHNRR